MSRRIHTNLTKQDVFLGKAMVYHDRNVKTSRGVRRTTTWPAGPNRPATVHQNAGLYQKNDVSPPPPSMVTFAVEDTVPVKYVSLVTSNPGGSSSLSSGSPKSVSGSSDQSVDSQSKSLSEGLPKVVTYMPVRATLHRSKQIPGRFFPSPSLSQDQKIFLQGRKKQVMSAGAHVPHHRQNGFYFQTGSGGRGYSPEQHLPRTKNRSKSCDVNPQQQLGDVDIYDIGSLENSSNDFPLPSGQPVVAVPLTPRVSSIPSISEGFFKDVMTGTPKRLHGRDGEPGDRS